MAFLAGSSQTALAICKLMLCLYVCGVCVCLCVCVCVYVCFVYVCVCVCVVCVRACARTRVCTYRHVWTLVLQSVLGILLLTDEVSVCTHM